MKEKIINSIKRVKPKFMAFNQIILGLVLLTSISLSIINGGLLLKEQIITSFILLFAIISSQSKNKEHNN